MQGRSSEERNLSVFLEEGVWSHLWRAKADSSCGGQGAIMGSAVGEQWAWGALGRHSVDCLDCGSGPHPHSVQLLSLYTNIPEDQGKWIFS